MIISLPSSVVIFSPDTFEPIAYTHLSGTLLPSFLCDCFGSSDSGFALGLVSSLIPTLTHLAAGDSMSVHPLKVRLTLGMLTYAGGDC